MVNATLAALPRSYYVRDALPFDRLPEIAAGATILGLILTGE